MKTFLFIIVLFIGVFCGDYRSPSPKQKKCLEKKIGNEKTKELLESLKKYNRTNAKATILDFILEEKPELKNVAEECLLKIKRRRRLNKRKKIADKIDNAFNNDVAKYYMDALLRDPGTKDKILRDIHRNRNDAVKSCQKFVANEEICDLVINMIIKNIIQHQQPPSFNKSN